MCVCLTWEGVFFLSFFFWSLRVRGPAGGALSRTNDWQPLGDITVRQKEWLLRGEGTNQFNHYAVAHRGETRRAPQLEATRSKGATLGVRLSPLHASSAQLRVSANCSLSCSFPFFLFLLLFFFKKMFNQDALYLDRSCLREPASS